jgi:hypothetical protein
MLDFPKSFNFDTKIIWLHVYEAKLKAFYKTLNINI